MLQVLIEMMNQCFNRRRLIALRAIARDQFEASFFTARQ